MKQLRGAVIGCGMVSDFHLLGWQRIPEATVVALCDPIRSRAEAQAEKFAAAAHVYNSATELFKAETVDFVDIVAPPSTHKELCLKAKDAHVHVLCQKPLCPEFADAVLLIEAFRNHSKYFVVHENHRYRPWFRRILELHESGFFGEIKYLRLEQHDPHEPAEQYKLQSSRGIMLEYGVHLVDMMRALLGEPQRVSASFGHINPRVQGESLAVATYQYDRATAVIDIAWKPAGPEHGCLIVEGERGTAYYEGTMTRGQSSRFRVFQEGQAVIDEMRSPSEDYAESFYLLQRQFTNCLLDSSLMPPQPATDNLQTLQATLAAYDSTRAGQPIAITWPR
jgi:predicted dehydrogenase